MKLRLQGGRGLAGQPMVELEGVGHALPDNRELLRDVTFRLSHGETLGILGRNGAGKTTLLRLLQEMVDLPHGGTVLEALQALDATVPERELRDHLARFLFCGDDVDKPVASLSGGEKRRLCLARLTRSRYDYLCLDEPTNHLDITAREGLEDALRAYGGATVLISHDRELLEAVADRVAWVEDGEVTVYDGGLQQCLLRRAEARSKAIAGARQAQERSRPAAPAPAAAAAAAAGKVRNPMLFRKLEDKIMGLEDELGILRDRMARPESYLDPDAMRDLQQREAAAQRELDRAYEEWESWT
jgi:ATPase subunit of ABC transporter with duplicated ATPase domains